MSIDTEPNRLTPLGGGMSIVNTERRPPIRLQGRMVPPAPFLLVRGPLAWGHRVGRFPNLLV